MNNEPTVCPQCRTKLIEIDYYGERLIGCIECNRWTWRGSKSNHLIMELPEKDLEALGNLSDKRHKDEDTSP